MKKYINELSQEELKKVFSANNKLQGNVLEDALDSEMYWVSEKLEYIKESLRDWSIGPDNRNYIEVKNTDLFISGLMEMDKIVPLFSDSEAEFLYKVNALNDKLNNTEEPDEGDYEDEEGELDEVAYEEACVEYEALLEQFNNSIEKLESMVVDNFTKQLSYYYSHDALEAYFLEFYAENRLEAEEVYILEEEGTYELYEDVAYTKSFKGNR